MKYVKVPIPQELKDEWERDKHLSEECEVGKNGFLCAGDTEKIQMALSVDNITEVLKRVKAKTTFSSYAKYVQKEGFFKDILDWIDFMLITFMDKRGIDTSEKGMQYIYMAMNSMVNNINKNERIFREKEQFVEWTSHYISKSFDFYNIHPQLYEMCAIFYDICVGKAKPAKEVDISYQAFLEYKKQLSDKSRTMKKN